MNNLVWFGNNLRVADNRALLEACKGGKVIGVFCFDPRWQQEGDFGFRKMGRYRARFLIETVTNLQKSLKKLNISLLVFHDTPENILPKIIDKHDIQSIMLQEEWTRDEKRVMQRVRQATPENIGWRYFYDQFLYHPDDLPYPEPKNIPEVFTEFRKRLEADAQIRPVEQGIQAMPETNLLQEFSEIPTLESLGYEHFETDPRTAFPFKGGEEHAMERVEEYFWEKRKLSYYKKTRNGLLGKDYSSKFSAWLANGSISARTIYREVKNYETEVVKNQDTYWLVFELLWRDYFKYISMKHGDAIFSSGGIKKKSENWQHNQGVTDRWISGSTTSPFVNANMKELAHTGWMSNRGRQNAASFWSRELHQDWRIGAAYFECMLIDYDVHSNWGNWMYNSGVGNDPRDRTFNTELQAQRYDPSGRYRRLWLQDSLFAPIDAKTTYPAGS